MKGGAAIVLGLLVAPALAAAQAEPTAAVATSPEAPAASEPATEPTASEPTATEPTASEPTATEPAASEPTASEPTASEPAASTTKARPAEPEQHVRNRTYFGALVGLAPIAEEPGETGLQSDLEFVLGESLTARLLHRGGWDLDLIAAGRMDLRLSEEGTRLDDPRIRALGFHLASSKVDIDLGRFSPKGGVWRLVDGVAVRGNLGKGVYLGAWGGLSPDPWSTAPALRYGGGPMIGWQGEKGEFSALGEVLATPEGLDRASGVAQGRVELGRIAEIEALVDLQTHGKEAPVVLSDATLRARFDPTIAGRNDLRIDLVYDAWSSWSYLVSTVRDPWLTRFAARSKAALDDPWIPQDTYDPTLYHMAGATVSWRPKLKKPEGTTFQLDLVGRYRHHVDPLRRYARGGVKAALTGLANGRVDVSLGQAFLWWSDEPATETSANLWASLDRNARVALDSSALLIVQPHDGGGGTWGPSVYADLFIDGTVGKGVSLAIGYAFTNSQDLDRWDLWNGLMARVGWTFDSARAKVRAPQETP